LPLRLIAYLSAFDTGEKGASEAGFTGIAFSVDGTEVKEFVAEGVLLFLLGEDGLEGKGQLTQVGGLGPGMLLFKLLGKETATAPGALGEAGEELITEGFDERWHRIGFDGVAGVHGSSWLNDAVKRITHPPPAVGLAAFGLARARKKARDEVSCDST
jgi:hypothetical protein